MHNKNNKKRQNVKIPRKYFIFDVKYTTLNWTQISSCLYNPRRKITVIQEDILHTLKPNENLVPSNRWNTTIKERTIASLTAEAAAQRMV